MRRLSAVTTTLLLLFAIVVTPIVIPETVAQDATPRATPEEAGLPLPEGITLEVMSYGYVEGFPGAGFFEMVRVTMDPGVTFGAPNDPAVNLIYIESGEVTFRIDSGPVFVVRDAAEMGFGAPFEEVPAGTEFTLGQGEGFVIAPFTTGEARNDGLEPVVWTLAAMYPPQGATPEASPEAD